MAQNDLVLDFLTINQEIISILCCVSPNLGILVFHLQPKLQQHQYRCNAGPAAHDDDWRGHATGGRVHRAHSAKQRIMTPFAHSNFIANTCHSFRPNGSYSGQPAALTD